MRDPEQCLSLEEVLLIKKKDPSSIGERKRLWALVRAVFKYCQQHQARLSIFWNFISPLLLSEDSKPQFIRLW